MRVSRNGAILVGILVLGAGLRLAGIGNPLIGHHSWRQGDTAAMARNFQEERFHILYPRIDWRGASSGEVECEFPVYPFTVAALYRFVGVHEILGRLLSLCLSLITVAGVFLLSQRVAGPAVGLWAAFFAAVLPMPIFFGRAFMPEALLLAACTYSVLLFLMWRESGSLVHLFSSALALALACLLKPPTLYLGLPLAYLACRRLGGKAFVRPELWVYAVVVFGSLVLWYTHAHRLKQETGLTFGVWEYGSDKWGNWDLVLTREFWETILADRVSRRLLAYFGLPLFAAGLLVTPRPPEEKIFSLWLAGMLVFVVIVAKGVYVHDYYLLPAAVPVSHYLGKAAARFLSLRSPAPAWARASVALCLMGALSVSLVLWQWWRNEENPSGSAAFQLAQAAQTKLPDPGLVIAVDRGDPTILYYSRRKGWRSFPLDLTEAWIEARSREGAAFILGVHGDFREEGARAHLMRILEKHEVVMDNGKFFIVKTGGTEVSGGDRRF